MKSSVLISDMNIKSTWAIFYIYIIPHHIEYVRGYQNKVSGFFLRKFYSTKDNNNYYNSNDNNSNNNNLPCDLLRYRSEWMSMVKSVLMGKRNLFLSY